MSSPACHRGSVQRLCHFYWGGIDRGGVGGSHGLAVGAASASQVRILAVRNRGHNQLSSLREGRNEFAALQRFLDGKHQVGSQASLNDVTQPAGSFSRRQDV